MISQEKEQLKVSSNSAKSESYNLIQGSAEKAQDFIDGDDLDDQNNENDSEDKKNEINIQNHSELNLNMNSKSDADLIKDTSNTQIDAHYPSLYNPNISSGNYFQDDYCSICKFQILKNKYLCVLCENFKLCSRCESSHNQHPLIKINIDCHTFTTKEEIVQHMSELAKREEKKKSVISSIKSMFKPSPPYVNLYPCEDSTIFAMAAGSKKEFLIQVHNFCNKAIQEEIAIIPMNNKTFGIKTKIIEKLNVDEVKNVTLIFESPLEEGEYDFEIHSKLKNNKIIYEPIRFQVTVTKPQEVDEANANLLFAQYDEIMKMPKENRLGIYIFWKDCCKREFNDFIRILSKYKYVINDAFDELISESENKGECYYEPHLHI
jgi:hypothetical protein